MSPRAAAALTLAVLLVVIVVLVAWFVPWRTLAEVPGGAVAADPSRDFSAAEVARADDYRSSLLWPSLLGLAVSTATAVVLGLTPLGARLVEAVSRPVGDRWWAAVLLGGLALAVLGALVTLPLQWWTERLRRQEGLSTRTTAAWLLDLGKGFVLTTVVLLIVLLVLVWLVRTLPSWWWVPASALAAGLVVVLSFIYPVVVEPVFNSFEPMPDGPLRTSLVELAERDGVPVSDVLVADQSKRTTALNAYVSGFGSTRRIVVYDTLLAEATPEEVESVVAHELGHAKEQDVLVGTALGALALAAAVCGLALVGGSASLLSRAGATSLGDPRSIALVLAYVAVVGLLVTPVQSLLSRRVEARADVHALDLTRDPTSFVEMQRRLALTNVSDLTPNPVVYALFATHPSTTERIALSRSWSRVEGLQEPRDLVLASGATS